MSFLQGKADTGNPDGKRTPPVAAPPTGLEKAVITHTAFDEENDAILPVTLTAAPKPGNSRLPLKDVFNFLVLIMLYALQGVPVGLAFGSVPFILKSRLTYAQVGVFSLASYPYSLKLLWSPVVDAVYNKRVGRRKSWILPMQTISGLMLLGLGNIVDDLLDYPEENLHKITFSFLILMFLCATQDIAVDGWALTCLSPESLLFASPAQTIGMNIGYFLSFTIFLALNSMLFANKYRKFPSQKPLVELGIYLRFWGWIFLGVTFLMLLVPEYPAHLRERMLKKQAGGQLTEKTHHTSKDSKLVAYWKEIKAVYITMFKVLRLRNIQILVVILLFSKLGFQVNEAATNLKLIEKGFSREYLSIAVMIDFPFEVIFSYYVGSLLSGSTPLKPWIYGMAGRLFAAAWGHLILMYFPVIEEGNIPKKWFYQVIAQHLLGSFTSTIQFVSMCAFYTRIADPSIGGTYMTTLNTVSNFGGTWPRFFIFYLIDRFTTMECMMDLAGASYTIITEEAKRLCTSSDGKVVIQKDGYYTTSLICLTIGVYVWFVVKRKLKYLQALPQLAWRVSE